MVYVLLVFMFVWLMLIFGYGIYGTYVSPNFRDRFKDTKEDNYYCVNFCGDKLKGEKTKMKDVDLQKRIDSLLKNGWSYGKLAKELGVSKTTISRWHKGENKPKLLEHYQAINSLYFELYQAKEGLDCEQIGKPKTAHNIGDRVNMDGSRRYWIVTDIDTSGPFPVYKMSSEDETNKNYYVIGDKELKKCSVRDVDNDESKHKVIVDTSPVFVNIDEEIKYFEGRIAELKAQKEKDKWKFTEAEKVILRNLPKKYKWIARDQDGELNVYDAKIKKTQGVGGDGIWVFEHKSSLHFVFGIFNHLFQCIQWEDDEPCEFRKFI